MEEVEWDGSVSFGYWHQRRRKALDLTRAELAQRVGCSPVTIKKIERDERRPSRQLAKLLADHLSVPEVERNKFVRLARGQFVPPMTSPLDVEAIPLPAFLQTRDEPSSQEDAPFVGRARELTKLEAALNTARAGQGQILLVIGGAGRGKTMLVNEFARQAQAADDELIVISGYCNAHTGLGDPYLPFRELLNMLTGEVEAKWAAGLISPQHARRLWGLMPIAVPTPVEQAPNLIESLVTGQALLKRAATFATIESTWLKRLTALVARADRDRLEQPRLFTQYTAALKTIAAHRPLLLILEDLQWIDASSSALLFHLSREVGTSRILMVGTYRPEEVMLSWAEERHPLADIVRELKRQHGDIWLDLGAMAPAEGRQFVEAYLDTQPNRLGPAFREALFRRTEGHALFTVELVREMQERGDLRQDEEGYWVAGETIDWKTLPARVEGVIEKRIERLEKALQAILTIACVEGEIFTAEVVARIQQVNERDLVQQLSRELDKRHRLVTAQALERLDPGGQRLSFYRFRHYLFQHYLYHRLDPMERTYLHEAVGNALEALYGEQTEQVAVQLAHHFEQAGQTEKAVSYLLQAGDAATQVYANNEAIAHYRQALELVKQGEVDTRQLIHLYTHLGRALELNSQYDQALATYEEMEGLAHKRSDRSLELAALTARLNLLATFTPFFDPARGEALAEQALTLTQDLGDQAVEAKILWNLLNVYRFTGRVPQALECGERSLALARQLNMHEQIAHTLTDMAYCYLTTGHLDQVKVSLPEACDLWRKLDNLPMLADSLSVFVIVWAYSGEYDQAIACSDEAYRISQAAGNLWGQAHSREFVGYAYLERGQPGQAIEMMEDSIRNSKLSGSNVPQVLAQADLAATYGSLGAIKRGLETAHLSLTIAESQLPIFRIRVLAVLAQLYLLYGNLVEAEAVIDQAKQDPNQEGAALYSPLVDLAESELRLRQGDYKRVLTITDELLGTLRLVGARAHIPPALYLQGQALLGLGQDDIARDRLLEARAEAEAIGSRRMLWQILATLAEIETDPTEAETFRQQAREIIDYIADHTPADLRASFLNLPNVQKVLNE